MRWPFSRRGTQPSAPEPAAAPLAGAPLQRSESQAPPQPRAEWATLPPIQRSAADPIELTAESGLFVENLTSRSSIEPALAPLGHDVTIDAPHGIASGIARPVEHRSADAPPLQHRLHPTPAPAQARAAASAPAVSAGVQRAPLPAPAAPPPAAAPIESVARHEGHAEEEVATSPAPEPVAPEPVAPVQRAPEEAVAPTPAASAPAGSAPAAPPAEAPAPVQRAPEAPTAEAPAAAPDAEPELPVAPAPTLPAVAAQDTVAAPSTPDRAAASTPAPLVHRTAPAAKTPPAAAAPVQRAAAEPPAPAAPAAPVESVARHEGHGHEEEVATSPAPAPEAPAPAPVQRAPEEAVAPAPAPAPAAAAPAAPAEAVSPTPAPAEPAPAAVQRQEAAEAEEEEAATMPAVQRQEAAEAEEEEAATMPAAVQRAAEEQSAPTVGARPVVTATLFRSSLGPVSETVGLQRSDPLTFAAQRSPGEVSASPAAGLTGQPSIAASSPQPPAAPAPGGVQRTASTSLFPDLTQRSTGPVAPRPVDIPQQLTAPAPAAPGISPVQRSAESAPATAHTSPASRERPLGLGAPFKPHEAPSTIQRQAIPAAPAEVPHSSLPPTFRRTRSSLSAQRSPEGAPPAAAPDADAPSPQSAAQPGPTSAPLVGASAPLAESQAAAPAGLHRSEEGAAPAEPLPPLATPGGVQRAPIDAPPPAEAIVQRAEETPAGAVASSGGLDAFIAGVAELQAGRVPEAMAGPSVEAPTLAAAPAERTGPLAPRLDLPHRRRESSPRSQASAGPATAAAVAVQRAPEARPRPQLVPVVGQRPLRVQRSAEDVPAPVRSHVERQIATPISDVKVHRSPETATVAREIKAKAFTTGGEIHMPADHGPLDREPARSLVAHELVHVAQQRQLGASLPTEDSHHGQALERQAQRVEASSAAESSAPLVLARKPDPGTIAETAATLAVQRVEAAQSSSGSGWPSPSPVVVSSHPGGGTVQRAVEISELTTNVNVNEGQRGGGGGGGGPSGAPDPITGHAPQIGGGSSEAPNLAENQLEQTWIYVRARLADELNEDRERAGMTIDLF